MLKEFKTFIVRGNVIDLAVGVIMGAAFGKIVTTLVEGILMPPLGLVLGRIDFSSLFYVLDRSKVALATSLPEAKAAGIPVVAYGQFVNDIFSFIVVAAGVFLLVKQVNALKRLTDHEEAPAPATKECPYCISAVPMRATRCAHCTSEL